MKKSVIYKKLLSALLSLAMLAALPIPMSASAEEEGYTNLALKKAITATESYNPPEGFFGVGQLVDGIWETYPGPSGTLGWNCDPNAPNSQDTPIDIDIDLGCVCWTDKMVLKPMQWANGKGFPKALELQVSTDGETWTTVASESDIDASAPSDTEVQPRVYTFEKVSLRYARIHISLRSDDVESTATGMHNASLGEWEIWGVVQVVTADDLRAAIREAEAMDATAYALSTVTVLRNAVAAARALLEDGNATSQDYGLAEDAIRTALAGLLPRGESVNLALDVMAECANSYTPPEGFYNLAFLTDGQWLSLEGDNIRLGWHTDPYMPLAEYDTLDLVIPLGTLCAVEQVVLKPMKWSYGQTFPQDFEIQVSLDGTQWKTVASETGADASVPQGGDQLAANMSVQARTYEFDPVQARYVRLHITRQGRVQDATGSCLTALGEMEVYGYEDGEDVMPVTLNKTALRMNPGETDWLSLNADKRLPTPVVTYQSGDETVVTVDADGTVHAQTCGETDILVTDETSGGVYTCHVLVDNYRVSDHFQIVAFIPYFFEKDINPTVFDNLKAGGITNVEMNFALDAAAITYENNLKAIALAYERGLDVTVSESGFNGSTWPTKTDAEILDFAKRYSHIPGVVGYYIVDEPGTAAPFAHAMALIKSVMPYAVTHINFCGAYADNVRGLYRELEKYGGGILDYVMYDSYVFTSTACNEELLYSQLDYNMALSRELGVPGANYIQSMSWQPWINRPNADAIRYQVWVDLAYGLKQISYFCWQTPRSNAAETYGPAIIDIDGNPTDLFEPVSEINAAVQALGPTLMKLDAGEVYHTGRNFGNSFKELPAGFYLQPTDLEQSLTVSRMTEKETGREYCMVVNRDYKNAATVSFTLDSEVKSVSYISTKTGQPVALTAVDGVYTVELLAGEGVLLQMDEGFAFTLKDITNFYHLKKAIAAAEALNMDDYKDDGKEAFNKALDAARTLVADESATQTQVDKALAALNKAMKELKPYATDSVNLALNRPVNATSSYSEPTYFNASFLTDGVHTTLEENTHAGWSANPYDNLAQDTPVDITVDLGEKYLIQTVVLKPTIYNEAKSFPKSLTLQVSEDGKNWVDVASLTDVVLTAPVDQLLQITPTEGRYVRVHITCHSDVVDGGTGGYLSQLSELEVYGQEIAPDETETDPVDTDPVDTDPVDTDPVDTCPVDTDPVDTCPVDTDPVDTDPVDTDPVDTDPVDTDPVESGTAGHETDTKATAGTDNGTASDTGSTQSSSGCKSTLGGGLALVALITLAALSVVRRRRRTAQG